MPLFRLLVAAAASLALSSLAIAQPAPAPVRPAPRPAVAPVPGQQPPAAAPRAPRAAACHNGMSFDRFLADLKQQAVADGVSQRALAEAAPYLVYDQSIVNRDRGQRVFGQVFNEFARNRASDGAAKNAQARVRMHAAAFARAEKEYGVPPAVIAAFWGLESSFGAELGKLHTLPSLVSLAYDCRRSEMFTKETIAALKIIDRGDLTASEMIGSWAGELGQTQFLPTHYFNYAVDYDGDGHRDMLRSVPDVIGSTANYIANGLKWRRGEPWLQEVRAPANFPWDQADLTVKLSRAKFAQLGVTYPDGRALPNDDMPASLLLPMGRTGTSVSGVREFRRLHRVEQFADLFDHRGLSRHPHRRRPADAAAIRAGRATAAQRAERAAAAVGARGLQCRQGRRRDGAVEPHGGEGDAGEVRPAGGFLADGGAVGADARPRRTGATRRHGDAGGAVSDAVIPRTKRGRNPVRRSLSCSHRNGSGILALRPVKPGDDDA